MPILDLQQRQRELGRIRIGHKVGAKGRPEKLDKFRFTSPSRELIVAIAETYGGTAQPWTGNGTDQWEVITEAKRLPILVPPQPVTQWYELWSGGGCQRRCDGMTEQLSDAACICGPDPEGRDCKPTTRISVVLRDVHGIGVWRLESHGYYAAIELPQTAGFIASATAAGTYLPAHLALEERVVTKPGQPTRRFVVPTIEVEVTPAQLMAGDGAVAIGGNGHRELAPAAPDAIEPARVTHSEVEWLALVQAATTVDEIRALWRQSGDEGTRTDAVTAAMQAKSTQLQPSPEPSGDPDEVWQRIVMACPSGWTLGDLEVDFYQWSQGKDAEHADAATLNQYLAKLTGVAV